MLTLPDQVCTEVQLVQVVLNHGRPRVQLVQHVPGSRHRHRQHERRVADRLRTQRELQEVRVRRVAVQHPHRETGRGCRQHAEEGWLEGAVGEM